MKYLIILCFLFLSGCCHCPQNVSPNEDKTIFVPAGIYPKGVTIILSRGFFNTMYGKQKIYIHQPSDNERIPYEEQNPYRIFDEPTGKCSTVDNSSQKHKPIDSNAPPQT